MEQRRSLALRVPTTALAIALVLFGLVTLPTVMLIVAVTPGSRLVLLGGFQVLMGYLLAGLIWLYSRRVKAVAWTWALAAVGLLLIIAASLEPLSLMAHGFYEEWKETQPGGRGYYQ